jgi:hypothetical protein
MQQTAQFARLVCGAHTSELVCPSHSQLPGGPGENPDEE